MRLAKIALSFAIATLALSGLATAAGEDETTLKCPADVTAEATPGGIQLRWRTTDARVEEYSIQRRVGNGPIDPFYGRVAGSATSFFDRNVVDGQAYSYQVVPEGNRLQSPVNGCPPVTATAIPFFPGMLGAAIAVLGTVGVVAVMRRK